MSTSYTIDNHRVIYREDGYIDFWGRKYDSVLHQTDSAVPHIDTYRFPMEEDAPVGDCIVYLTGGMSDLPQPGTEEYDEEFQRMEISTFAEKVVMNQSGKIDFIGWVVGWMAHYPFEQNTYFLPGQTFDWGKPITPESEMHGFYFARLPFVNQEQLCELSGTAKSIIHLVTLSKAELDFKLEHGADALLEHLGECGVPPFFDLSRRCSLSPSE